MTNQKSQWPKRMMAHLGVFNINLLHLRKPWIIGWWSAAFPGFGHLLLGSHVKGFTLILWEVLINVNAGINESMVYAFNGQIAQSIEALNERWLLLYISVYVYAIWDSYRTAVELNKEYLLAQHSTSEIPPMTIDSLAINYFDKRSPWLAMTWSLLMPGLGQLYVHRIVVGFFLLGGMIYCSYQSHFMEGLLMILEGKSDDMNSLLSREWALFMPSLYGFAAYDAYMMAVENNKLYERVQRHWLERNYQKLHFDGLAER